MDEIEFDKWLDTFIEEKGLDTESYFDVNGSEWGWNFIPLGCVIEAIKSTHKVEQARIRDTLVRIDFVNGDIMDYFKHLAKAIAL